MCCVEICPGNEHDVCVCAHILFREDIKGFVLCVRNVGVCVCVCVYVCVYCLGCLSLAGSHGL